ncbi:MAG: cobalt ECF transporter T component CbiQ [Methanomicrobiaceae archaeon]|nr:cobalt ECF transporter T component CbiQ [Methanomicrobiaceae archaeon]
MHETLEDFALNNGLRDVSPALKLALGLCCMLLSVSSPAPVAPLLIACSLTLVVLFSAGIPAGFYLKLLTIPASFAAMSILVILFLTGGGEVLVSVSLPGLPLTVTTGGANLAVLLLARISGGMCALFFISLTTPATEIFSLMRRCGLPAAFIDLSMLIYRYIFVFISEAEMIYRSQVMRLGYGSLREAIRSFGMLAGALFLRTWESGERLMVAMDARCYDGRFGALDETPPVSAPALVAVALYLAALLGIACLTMQTTIF